MVSKTYRKIALVAAVLCFSTIRAELKCDGNTKCPESSPCCSEYGYCGGSYDFCGAACFKTNSFKEESCWKLGQCLTTKIHFNNTNRVVENSKYNSDFLKYDFTYQGFPRVDANSIALTMKPGDKPGETGFNMGEGSKITSTRSYLYGKFTARVRSAGSLGAVSSFILFSSVKDEIDWEWVGKELSNAQTNYFYQGIPEYNKGRNFPVYPPTNQVYHDYTIDWKEDSITWSIDGIVLNQLLKSETYDAGSNIHKFPSSASQIQFGVWDGGNGPEGTRQWAGGPTDWNQPKDRLEVHIESLDITCYGSDPQSIPHPVPRAAKA